MSFINLPHNNLKNPAKIQVCQRAPRYSFTDYDLRRDAIEAAAHHFCNMLAIEGVKIRVDMYSSKVKHGDAHCMPVQDGVVKIRIKRDLSMQTIVTMLAHELVHARQFVSGTLKQKDYDTCIWKGEEMADIKICDNYAGYRATPWEAEAYEMQDLMVEDFLAHQKAAKTGLRRAFRLSRWHNPVK